MFIAQQVLSKTGGSGVRRERRKEWGKKGKMEGEGRSEVRG